MRKMTKALQNINWKSALHSLPLEGQKNSPRRHRRQRRWRTWWLAGWQHELWEQFHCRPEGNGKVTAAMAYIFWRSKTFQKGSVRNITTTTTATAHNNKLMVVLLGLYHQRVNEWMNKCVGIITTRTSHSYPYTCITVMTSSSSFQYGHHHRRCRHLHRVHVVQISASSSSSSSWQKWVFGGSFYFCLTRIRPKDTNQATNDSFSLTHNQYIRRNEWLRKKMVIKAENRQQ